MKKQNFSHEGGFFRYSWDDDDEEMLVSKINDFLSFFRKAELVGGKIVNGDYLIYYSIQVFYLHEKYCKLFEELLDIKEIKNGWM